MTTIKANDTS